MGAHPGRLPVGAPRLQAPVLGSAAATTNGAVIGDHVLYLIPDISSQVPDVARFPIIVELLGRLAPTAESASISVTETVRFFDAGENLESIRCPACEEDVDFGWWGESMGMAYEADFEDLSVTTPCCSTSTTLHDLEYDWQQGFARWAAELRNPDRGRLGANERAELDAAAGVPLREIWQHV